MKYCMECGTKLEDRYLEGEGMIPYCKTCNQYRFPGFNTAVSMIVMNKSQDKILLIQQYGKKDFILVAGYVNKGENAEQAVVREIGEELGLEVSDVQYNRSQYFEKSNTLIFNYTCTVVDEKLDGITEEVDYAEWFSIEEAQQRIKKNSLAQAFLNDYISNRKASSLK